MSSAFQRKLVGFREEFHRVYIYQALTKLESFVTHALFSELCTSKSKNCKNTMVMQMSLYSTAVSKMLVKHYGFEV